MEQTAPLLPNNAYDLVRAQLENFFSSSEYACLSPEQRADHLATLFCGPQPVSSKKPERPDVGVEGSSIRVLVTGCFDLMHAGHYNALRQARAVFENEDPDRSVTLVAGVHSDEAIEKQKGALPVMNDEERCKIVAACKWVDEVEGGLAYSVPVSLLDRLKCNVIVHGDDLPVKKDGGVGLFDEVRDAGRLRIVRRTEGVSTTVLLGRLVSLCRDHHFRDNYTDALGVTRASELAKRHSPPSTPMAASDSSLAFLLPTMSRMVQFYGPRSEGRGRMQQDSVVVYVPGEWDLFHVGHLEFLKEARKHGDFLLVGLYNDEMIHRKKGRNFPLQTLHERALNLLSCRYVDDIVLAAPWQASEEFLRHASVKVVVTGSNNPYKEEDSSLPLQDPFAVVRKLGMLQVVASTCDLTMDHIAERILSRAQEYVHRQQSCEANEAVIRATSGKVPEI
eukprot:gnl/MRDRNA2_/MRDRNA2_34574_c0_seq1.p1 gnl/MRDRNA2_/MRDRNA2_34574_c0~~gnl/MRDRNA2_/MRDRNA2_34574_c0_seq1.p1  ORF type:complete len:449 (+),score=71.93 gnl/MRDRNA2_/MRDRNA2_34574_c0_seq1:103-1449(+)